MVMPTVGTAVGTNLRERLGARVKGLFGK